MSQPSLRRTGGFSWRFLAALVLTAEGVLLLVIAVGYLVALGPGHPQDRAGAVATLLLAAVGGVVVLWLARLVHRGRPASTVPALLTQVFALVVGRPLATGDRWYVGAPLFVLAIVGILALALAGRPLRSTPQ